MQYSWSVFGLLAYPNLQLDDIGYRDTVQDDMWTSYWILIIRYARCIAARSADSAVQSDDHTNWSNAQNTNITTKENYIKTTRILEVRLIGIENE